MAADPERNGGNEIDLGALAGRLWDGRWWIVMAGFVSGVAFVAAAILMTPIYRATTVMVPTNNNSELGGLGSALGQLGGLVSLAGGNFGGADARTQEALAVLRSREFNEEFIRDQGMLQILYANRWDPATKSWKGDPKDWPTLARAFKRFDLEIRTLTRDKLTGVTTVSIEWKDPALAAKWANSLVTRLNSEMRVRAIDRTSAAVGYLEKELATTSAVETRQAINRLMEAQINQRMLANVTEEFAFRVVDPALLPDKSDIVRPKKVLMALTGPIIGGAIGAMLVLMVGAVRRRRVAAK